MGCASSKQPRCRHCQNSFAPVPRSYSMHVHHPPQSKGDSYHVVALTSTTLGTLKLDTSHQNRNSHVNGTIVEEEEDKENKVNGNENVKAGDKKNKGFSMGLIEAKTWSSMINEKIPKIAPKTPIRTPPGEPETINAWELMEGLEDASPLRSPNHLRSFSFDIDRRSIPAPFELPSRDFRKTGDSEMNPNSNSKTAVPEFDPEVISMFRKSLQELPSDDPFHIKDDEKVQAREVMDAKKVNDDEKVQAREVMDVKKVNDDYDFDVLDHKSQSFAKDTVVVYFTSLRGVRKTYEDCCHVRVILKSLGIRLDERDVSMHSGFKEELKDLLGDAFNSGSLPRVFLGRRYIGGAEDVRRMHEEGQLEKTLEDSEKQKLEAITCSGSCKIYYEGDEEDDDEEGEFGFQRCPDCNENGLIRCPICCYYEEFLLDEWGIFIRKTAREDSNSKSVVSRFVSHNPRSSLCKAFKTVESNQMKNGIVKLVSFNSKKSAWDEGVGALQVSTRRPCPLKATGHPRKKKLLNTSNPQQKEDE
ncbi:hypothetical protein AAG906_019799 [Vitis piasezkii]